jgi:hypothetical protein
LQRVFSEGCANKMLQIADNPKRYKAERRIASYPGFAQTSYMSTKKFNLKKRQIRRPTPKQNI